MTSPLQAFKAEFFKALAHPVRIRLIEVLREGERSVSELTQLLGLEPANVSQQLAVLRNKNIVATRREGTTVRYSVKDPALFDLLDVARQIFNNHLIGVQDVLQAIQDEG